MDKIIYWNTYETTLFAVEELRRLMGKIDLDSEIHDQTAFARLANSNRINLITTDVYHAFAKGKEPITIKDDGFALVESNGDVWIIGNEARGILYGMYQYCRNRFGYQWINLDEETIIETESKDKQEQYIHEPMFARRGNIIETINDPSYINTLIDWGVKNGQNEYFFTFFLWDEVKAYIIPELQKRDVQVTLGGHSLSYLLGEIQADTSEEVLEQDKKIKFFADNINLQNKVINKIVAICLENKVVRRISLWPEDIGIDEKNASEFMSTYIQFTDKLKKALHSRGLNVEVEHIVYNAGLSWDMLEREEETVASDQADILYAYWGRDYSESIHASDIGQVRAYESLCDWSKQAQDQGRSLTVLEYYSDHFMLTELFPPLMTRIGQDLNDYKDLNINGVLNLIVPLHQKQQSPLIGDKYPWKWIHHLNNYIYTRLAWGEKYETIVEAYFAMFKEEKTVFKQRIEELEKLVSQHTKSNAPLFPARIVDPEKVEERTKYLDIPTYLNDVHGLLSTYDLTEIESLLEIQTKDNYRSFTVKEMTLIYFYYLKQVSKLYAEAWG